MSRAETHPYISTGLRQHKFGVPIAKARKLYRKAATYTYLDPVGVSVHIGSQITDVKPFGETMERVLTPGARVDRDWLEHQFCRRRRRPRHSLSGWQRHRGQLREFERSVKAYAAALMKPLRRTGLHLLLEPGRSIVAASGTLLTRTLYTKENGGKQFLVVDAAMNDLVRPVALWSPSRNRPCNSPQSFARRSRRRHGRSGTGL